MLSSKFRVFNEIFGSSDSILGTLEDGIDLQKAIIDIYTKCRTVEEINNAFDSIQEQYKEVIDESMKKTRQDLLDNFDEDLQAYFADVLDTTKASVSKIVQLFWELTKIILFNKAKFNDETRTFIYKDESYALSSKEGPFIDYNIHFQNLFMKPNVLKRGLIIGKFGIIRKFPIFLKLMSLELENLFSIRYMTKIDRRLTLKPTVKRKNVGRL